MAAFAQMPDLLEVTLQSSGPTFATTNIEKGQQWNSSVDTLNLSDNNMTDATELIKLRIFPNLETLFLDGNLYTNLSIHNNQTYEAPKAHPIFKNVFLSFSKPYLVPFADLITQFLSEQNKEYRTLTDVLPNLKDLSVRRVKIGCANMTAIARKLKSHQVEVKHDCAVK